MDLKKHFIKATEEFNTFEKAVPAPYLRKSFCVQQKTTGKITVSAFGFYELYFNGKNITRGFLAPYISNGDHYIYCDEYEVELDQGENVIGLFLGNGFMNNPGGYIWDFESCPYRSAPFVSLCLNYQNEAGEAVELVTDESFRTMASPTRSDDYRFGVSYDANYAIPGWADKGFDDSAWANALPALSPRGDVRVCEAAPIVTEKELKPVAVFPDGEGRFIYDFGESNSGVCRLQIRGKKGQKIALRHAELLKDGKLFLDNLWFIRDFWERDKKIVHLDTYTCSGEGLETWTPSFEYHGFRYVEVTGITEEQATADLLTFVVFHTRLDTMGGFSCSDPMANKIQQITRRSDVSNFHHYPTDCPQREKNGWTADAALSCEHLLLNFNPDANYREWMRNICKAQNDQGELPGIVPTYGWGYQIGPSWDCVLTFLPYYLYIYRGDTQTIRESAHAIVRYLNYINAKRTPEGLINYGLGDWCPPDWVVKSPNTVTSSIMTMDLAAKAALLLDAVDMPLERDYAQSIADSMRHAIREHLMDLKNMTVLGESQTSQSMGIYYGLFEEHELPAAVEHLVAYIHAQDDHFDVGVLGARVLFHVLSWYGYSDLAYKMITRKDYPSYGNWIERGATTLWEDFFPDKVGSTNHHFWGDVSSWFIQDVAGIQLNPGRRNVNEVRIQPAFVKALDHAEAFHQAPAGRISSAWKRSGDEILLTLEIPAAMLAEAVLPEDFRFEDGACRRYVASGTYRILPR